MRQIVIGLLLALCIAMPSCATVGRDFNESLVQELVVGKSTKEDAVALFGPPSSVTVTNFNDDFKEMLVWSYARAAAFSISTKGKSLMLTFDKDGILKAHSSSSIKSGL